MNSSYWIALCLVLLAAAICLLDLAAPANAACGTLYVAVVLLSLRFDRREAILVVALVCSVLICSAVVTTLLSPPSGEIRSPLANTFFVYRNPVQVLVNAQFELFAIWVAAIFAYRIKGLHRGLENRVERRSKQLKQVNEDLQVELDRGELAREQLYYSEAHYLSLVENLPIHVFRKDIQGRITFASPSFCELIGYPLDEILGKSDFDLYPRDLADKYRHDDLRVLTNRTVLNEVETNQLADGTQTWVQVIKVPLVHGESKVVGIQGIFWDVTERMKAEDRLRESEARNRAILESAMDSVVFLDRSGRVVELNSAALETLDATRGEIVDAELTDFFALAADRQQFNAAIERYVQIGEPNTMFGRRMEVHLSRQSGQQFLAELSAQPIPVQSSTGFAIFFRDITKQKAAEEAIVRAKDAAEAANRAKSLFLTNMSHEIRTPMNAIIGVTELLLNSRLSSDQHQYLRILEGSAESLLAVMNDLLDFSKIEAGKLDLVAVDFDLHERISDAMRTLAVRAHGKGLELACQIDPRTPRFVRGDETRLRQVLVNLVGNAIKFTERGEVVVRATLGRVENEQATIEFSVQDTGIGIPSDRREAVFAAFEQADNSITRQFGGTGLGLAISSRLVQLMSGRMWLQSEVGKGSTFYFTARFSVPTEPPPEATSHDLKALVGLPLLVVDDSATQRKVISQLLGQWNFEPHPAASVDQALEIVGQFTREEKSIPLAIVDNQMPTKDGFVLVDRLREMLPDCKVVMLLTSADRTDSVARCESLDLAAYLLKPINPSELLDAIFLALAPEEDESTTEQQQATALVAHRQLDILLAEDSLVNQKLAVGLLERFGHHVSVANNGKEAVDKINHHEFDLVLMDVQMPEMDGLEATRTIRRHEEKRGSHVPIIAMTAHAIKGYRETCMEAGMDGYVAKPIRAGCLMETIRDVLGDDTFLIQEGNGGSGESGAAVLPVGVGVVDWQRAMDVVQGDRDLLRDVISTFLDECNSMVNAIRLSIAEKNREALHRSAHTLKGSMRYFGADESYERCLELENMGKDSQFEAAAELLPRLEIELDRIMPALSAFSRTGEFSRVGE
jgi:PAS domain S-box-containing protein